MVSFCNVPSLIPPTINRTTPQILSHFILNAFIATPRNSLFFRQGTISFSSNACIPSFGIDCYHSLRSIVLTSAQRSVKQILSIQAHSSSNTLEGRPATAPRIPWRMRCSGYTRQIPLRALRRARRCSRSRGIYRMCDSFRACGANALYAR